MLPSVIRHRSKKDQTTMPTPFKTRLSAIALALLTPLAALADNAHPKPAAGEATAASDMSDAEVRRIDLEAGKITLKHGEIKHLDMPGMTMVFVVKDKALIDKLKAGDKVKFRVIQEAGKLVVTAIQPAP